METLGKRISNLRREKGLKQEDLANSMNVSPQAVSKWENDLSCPDITALPQLAALLGVSTDVLLSGEAAREPDVKQLPEGKRPDLEKLVVRIVVDSSDGDKVRINLPMMLVKAAMDMGMQMPQISGNDSLKNIDFSQILDLASQGVLGNLVEVESSDGDVVRIFVEEI